MNKQAITFSQVADEVGLKGKRKKVYVLYMTTRWGETEYSQCTSGYAREWAVRFKKGIEYQMSDRNGQGILDVIKSYIIK